MARSPWVDFASSNPLMPSEDWTHCFTTCPITEVQRSKQVTQMELDERAGLGHITLETLTKTVYIEMYVRKGLSSPKSFSKTVLPGVLLSSPPHTDSEGHTDCTAQPNASPQPAQVRLGPRFVP